LPDEEFIFNPIGIAEKTPPDVPVILGVISASLKQILSFTKLNDGSSDGLITKLKVFEAPIQVPTEGVTVTTDVMFEFVLFTPKKEAISPLPETGNPIFTFELVQLNCVPGVPVKFILLKVAPLQIGEIDIAFTVGELPIETLVLDDVEH
jgi:hypothetical protein